MTSRAPLTRLLAPSLLALVAFGPALAHAQSILDRVRERASSRVESGAESRTNQKVDSAVDKTLDCAFDPTACAKKVPAPAPSPTPAPAPGSAEGAQPAGPADAMSWYAEQNGSRVGPMPRAQLDSMVAGGQVTAQTLVWREGLDGWTAAGELPELARTFEKVPPPLPGPSGPPPLPSGRAR